jgi:hypothetical protein
MEIEGFIIFSSFDKRVLAAMEKTHATSVTPSGVANNQPILTLVLRGNFPRLYTSDQTIKMDFHIKGEWGMFRDYIPFCRVCIS